MNSRKNLGTRPLRRTSLAIGLGLCLMGTGAIAQSTTGSIFGQAKAGETVVVKGSTGVTRQAAVGADGRYNVGSLPVGTYTVTLQRDGQVVDSRSDVSIRVGSGTDVSFGQQSAQNLAAVTVQANALPSIDVSAVDTRTVITAEQLKQLPLGRSTEAIALLAPGAVGGSGFFTGPSGNNLVSFGGASVTENAYYINGMNVTDPLNGLGGIDLPYGSIEQLEVLSGGYGAAYGRSDGGVLNQVGKRGTNEWHFGGQVLYTPDWGQADQDPILYPAAAGANAGRVYQYRAKNKGTTEVYSAYVGGPLIKDKLFLFASLEEAKTADTRVGTESSSAQLTKREFRDPKWYAKLDWNINDSNILELTGASTKHSYQANGYAFDYPTRTQGDFVGAQQHTKTSSSMWIAKYTGYITDNLTLSAQYGKQSTDIYADIGSDFDPGLIAILGGTDQNPAYNGGTPVINNQTVLTTTDPSHEVKGSNYRVDLTYTLGDHTITAGIDNQRTQDLNDGQFIPTDAGYAWEYQKVPAGSPILDGQVGAPAGQGYFVDKYIFKTAASIEVSQKAQYIEDSWQVSDRWLLKLGLRNDQFTNFNSQAQAYIRQTKPQWAPRLGASWDVNGDSSFKVYANAGRYYLALPTSVALRGASGSLYTREYYNYTGIDPATGYPTGISPINTVKGPGVPISENNEYGQPPDPNTVTAKSLTAQYQDEYIAGFDKKFNDAWTYGAKLTYRSLKNEIDDTCNYQVFFAAAQAAGLDTDGLRGCYFFNPGRGATFQLPDGNGGYGKIKLSADDLGFPHAKRNYYAASFYLEHPFDGTWFGRINYTYSKSYGNTEGQVRSDIGQSDIAATVDWDYPSLMEYGGGRLANDHKHALKIYGSYRFLPEWTISGNIAVLSGSPDSCLGAYGPDGTYPAYTGPYYHWCNGQPAPKGTNGDTPWTETVSANLEYRPNFADKKLALNVQVFNLFDQQRATQRYDFNLSGFGRTRYSQTPRYVRFGVTYDF